PRQRFGLAHDLDNPVEVEQGLTALKFNFDPLGWRAEGKRHRLAGRSLAHIEALPVLSDPGHLAVLARVLAAKSHDEDVEFRKSLEMRSLRSGFDRQQLQGHEGFRVGEKMLPLEVEVSVLVGAELVAR